MGKRALENWRKRASQSSCGKQFDKKNKGGIDRNEKELGAMCPYPGRLVYVGHKAVDGGKLLLVKLMPFLKAIWEYIDAHDRIQFVVKVTLLPMPTVFLFSLISFFLGIQNDILRAVAMWILLGTLFALSPRFDSVSSSVDKALSGE